MSPFHFHMFPPAAELHAPQCGKPRFAKAAIGLIRHLEAPKLRHHQRYNIPPDTDCSHTAHSLHHFFVFFLRSVDEQN